MAEPRPATVEPFAQADALARDGYALLRGAVPPDWRDELRAAFDAGELANDRWPVPRGADWRHAVLDHHSTVQAVCRLPQLLAAVGALIGERFFLGQVEGREPRPGGGHQALHRDFSATRPGDTVLAIVFLDDYGPANGATRVVPGSHRPAPGQPAVEPGEMTGALQLSGSAGDILVFEADLVHAGSLNASGGRRRSLLASYYAAPLLATHQATAHLRNVRMAPAWFEPAPG